MDPSRQNWGTTGAYRHPPVDKEANSKLDFKHMAKQLVFPDGKV